MLKRYARTALYGGLASVVAQICIELSRILVGDGLSTFIGLLLFAIVGAVLILTGFTDKAGQWAGFGADQPLWGLMHGAAMNAAFATKGGEKPAKALWKGFSAIAVVVFSGALVATIIAAVVTFLL